MTEQADLRVVAVLTVRNEERFIGACLANLIGQGVDVYVCDNESTDRTAEIAESYCGRGVIGLESVPFRGVYDWEHLLVRKEELFQALDADWLMHVDADEIHLPPQGKGLVDAIAEADRLGYDAIEFAEFTFVPTLEAPDHDAPDFQATLRTYYPFEPRVPHCVRAFKKHGGPIEIAWSGGHMVRFAQPVRLFPEPFLMKHYQFLSADHAVRKYVARHYREEEVEGRGWHGWRTRLRPEDIRLPATSELRVTATDDDLDHSHPWTTHWLDSVTRR